MGPQPFLPRRAAVGAEPRRAAAGQCRGTARTFPIPAPSPSRLPGGEAGAGGPLRHGRAGARRPRGARPGHGRGAAGGHRLGGGVWGRGGAGPITAQRGTFKLPRAPERRALAAPRGRRHRLLSPRAAPGDEQGRGGGSSYRSAPEPHAGTHFHLKEPAISHGGVPQRARYQNLNFIRAV